MIEKGPKSYKAGFASETLSTVIEVESCDKSIDEKRIVTELDDDILAYGTRFNRMVFVVWHVRNKPSPGSSLPLRLLFAHIKDSAYAKSLSKDSLRFQHNLQIYRQPNENLVFL